MPSAYEDEQTSNFAHRAEVVGEPPGTYEVPVRLSVQVYDLGGGKRFKWQAFLVMDKRTVTVAKSREQDEFPTSDLARQNAHEHLLFLVYSGAAQISHIMVTH